MAQEEAKKDLAVETEQSSKESVHPKKKSVFLLHFFLIVMLLLIGMGGVYWVYYQNNQTLKQLKIQNRQMAAQITDLRATVQQQSDLTTSNKNMIQYLQKIASNSQNDWRLEEANYLVQTANITLQFKKDIATSISLLKAADARLQGVLMTQSVLNLRKALINKIALLEQLPKVDVVNLYLRLQKLDDQVAALSWSTISSTTQKNFTNANLNASPQSSSWRRSFAKSWDAISKVLVVRYHKKQLTPLLTDQEQLLLSLQLKVLLAQGQWALLQHNQDVYSNSLQKAMDLLQHFCVQANDMTQHFNQELKSLSQQKVASSVPNMSDVLIAVKKADTRMLQQHLDQ